MSGGGRSHVFLIVPSGCVQSCICLLVVFVSYGIFLVSLRCPWKCSIHVSCKTVSRCSRSIALYPFLQTKPVGHSLTVKKLHNSQKFKKRMFFPTWCSCPLQLRAMRGWSSRNVAPFFCLYWFDFLLGGPPLITVAFLLPPSLYLLFKVIFSL